MTGEARLLLEEMQSALHRVHQNCFPASVCTEISYQMADKYLRQLLGNLSDSSFCSAGEELIFFKELLPLFIAEKEYYRLLNFAHTFCPLASTASERKRFWLKEVKRLGLFKQKHPAFFKYVEKGEEKDDALHYSRLKLNGFPEIKGCFLARLRYTAYAEMQLRV